MSLTFLFFKKRQKAIPFMVDLVRKRIAPIEEKTRAFIRGKAIATLIGYAFNILLWIVFLVALYYYLSFVLLAFAETRPLAEFLLAYVSAPLSGFAWGFVGFLPNLIALFVIAAITWMALQGLYIFFANIEKGVFEFGNFEPHWVGPTHMLVRVQA